MRNRTFGGALLIVVLATALATARFCGRSGSPRNEGAEYPSLEGTLCEVIDKTPAARPRVPLPNDPALAAWTEQQESGLEEALAIEAIVQTSGYGSEKPTDAELACARKLWGVVASRLSTNDWRRDEAYASMTRLVRGDAGSLERTKLARALELAADASPPAPSANSTLLQRIDPPTSADAASSVARYLAAFPSNARLRRALIAHFRPMVEDNYNSLDGDLDKTEIFMRETVESWPERAGLDYELLVASDWTSQDPKLSTWMWLRAPFARITLDLGPTGNSLRVVRDLRRGHPEITRQLLPVAERRTAKAMASNRKARWMALVAYLESDAPDPGDPPEPALARALEGVNALPG
jgi:hypothetical protein